MRDIPSYDQYALSAYPHLPKVQEVWWHWHSECIYIFMVMAESLSWNLFVISSMNAAWLETSWCFLFQKTTVPSNIFTESCDRYMIQQNGGSGIQFMETDMLTCGNYMCEPWLGVIVFAHNGIASW
jgi:hypothetical protein